LADILDCIKPFDQIALSIPKDRKVEVTLPNRSKNLDINFWVSRGPMFDQHWWVDMLTWRESRRLATRSETALVLATHLTGNNYTQKVLSKGIGQSSAEFLYSWSK
jgi:hypothetical protein